MQAANSLNASWIYFALMTPALYGVTNLIGKFLIEKKINDPFLIVILGSFTSLILGIIILAFKGFSLIGLQHSFFLLITGILLVIYLLPYFKALLIEDVSQVIPLLQFIPIFVLILSYIFLGETLTIKQLLGSALIIFSSFILGSEKIKIGIFTSRKTLWYMILASLFYAIAGVIFKSVVDSEDFWLAVAYVNISIGIGAIILLLWPPYRSAFMKEIKMLRFDVWGLITLNQSFVFIAQFSTFYALLLVSASLVNVILAIQPFFVLFYGIILSFWFPHIIKEDINKSTILIKFISIIIIFFGVYMIYI